ncbi:MULTISPECIES: metal ABC transporter permease [Thermogemmatispora]|uniref:ABC transporter permease n=1 Tax=Thermogemmatispora tikiterensis TaxID=1825093 RepID=A0A328VHH1_9CHLR|nr:MULTISPECIES: metal ABC transporter permease [Thermogemmatispora]RAQ97398.1 ABC transporter permease [Thermogemmatispora tikiterensis]
MINLLSYPFIQNAFLAGTCIAIVAAVTGYFLLLRGLTFAGHALPNIGFAGAAGAVLLGLDPLFGLLAFTIGAAVGIGLLGRNLRERDLAIGILMTFALALGLLFLSLYSGYAERVYSILFGTILGISRLDVLLSFGVSLLILISILLLFRPLLFSSYDPEVAEARGVPVRLLAVVFLVLVALTIAIAVQIVGALLVFTLLVGPAATAGRLALRPGAVILLAIALGLLYTWLGILLAVLSGTIPVSFFIAFLSFIVYLPARLIAPRWQRRPPQPGALPAAGAGLSQQASAR